MSLSTQTAARILRKKGKLLSAADMKKAVDVYRIDYNSDDPKKSDWIRFQNQKDTDPVQCFYYSRVLKRNFPGEGGDNRSLYLPRYLSIKASIMQGRTKCWKWAVSKSGFPGTSCSRCLEKPAMDWTTRRQLMKPVCSSFSKNQQERKRKNDEYKEKTYWQQA